MTGHHVNDLLPSLKSRRNEIERARRLPPDLAEAMTATGIFAMELPAALGGAQAPPGDVLRTIEAVASADGSAGWCAMVGMANNGAVGFMPDACAREVFDRPTAPVAGVFAPSSTASRVDGGVRVSGRWRYASGVTHCAWLWGGCVVTDKGKPISTPSGPEVVYVCIPVGELEVHDTWFVSGLRGTGSHDVTATDVFVPARRTFTFGMVQRPEPLYRMPVMGWFVSHVAAVSLGIARAALDELMEIAKSKVPTFSREVLADKPVAQVEMARAEAALGSARALLYDTVDALWQAAQRGEDPTIRERALNRVAAVHAVETGVSVARTALTLTGASGIADTAAAQRHVRDAEAITVHFSVAPHVWEDAGRVLFGREATAPMF